MMNSQNFQTTNQVPTVPLQFKHNPGQGYPSANNPNFTTSYSHLPPTNSINSQPNFVPVMSSNPIYEPQNKTNSQIIYRTRTLPVQSSVGSFHQSPNNQPILHNNQQNLTFQPSSVPLTTIRPHFINQRISQFRRDVSPMDNSRYRNVQFSSVKKDEQMQKYDSLRWQNKYEDLKTKYYQLLSIVQDTSRVQDSWLIEEQNKLLKQKIKLLEAKDQKYYGQVTTRIQKLINFHKQTTNQQCSLLIDRYRLENKFLQKV